MPVRAWEFNSPLAYHGSNAAHQTATLRQVLVAPTHKNPAKPAGFFLLAVAAGCVHGTGRDDLSYRGRSEMASQELPKLLARVRFPSPAPIPQTRPFCFGILARTGVQSGRCRQVAGRDLLE